MNVLSEQQGFLVAKKANSESKITYNVGEDSSNEMITDLYERRMGFRPISLLLISLYSTAMSCLFMLIAIVKPQYHDKISNRGLFSPSGATLLTAFLAKSIEITFVTVFLAFLGQILSKQATQSNGLTLASVTMRGWVLQPGTLFTQWEAFRLTCFSPLGLLCLLAALLTLLYTTASGALVQPQIRNPPWERVALSGTVQALFSNIIFAKQECERLWPAIHDSEFSGETCMQLKLSSRCGYNYDRYLTNFHEQAMNSTETIDPTLDENRPPVFAGLDNNITVSTAWLDTQDMQEMFRKWGRIVNNVTIAVPHPGIPAAARDPRNRLLQPEDLENAGSYSIHASVPNLAINSLCIHVEKEDLEPLVYEAWPNARPSVEVIKDMYTYDWTDNGYNNKTVLDDIFGWKDAGPEKASAHTRPVFIKFPKDFNTITNSTSQWGRSEVYVLGKAGKTAQTAYDGYTLCSLKTFLTSECSTRYNASSRGLTLESLCHDDAKKMAYKTSYPESESFLPNPDWQNVGNELVTSLSLGTGVLDANASRPRFFNQLQLQEARLNPLLPSPAEALSSMAMCTVLDFDRQAPYTMHWNYSGPTLNKPEYQYFNASVQVAQYMSGGIYPYQKGFIVVLALVFIINASILIYFSAFIRLRFMTDLCESIVLFLLGYHSPPDDNLFGTNLRAYPRPISYGVPWIVKPQGGQLVIVGTKVDDETSQLKRGVISRWKKRAGLGK